MPKKIILDIKKPEPKKPAKIPATAPPLLIYKPEIKTEKPRPKETQRSWRPVILALILIFGLLAGVSVLGFLDLKENIADAAPKIYDQFKAAANALTLLETSKAKNSIASASAELKTIEAQAENLKLFTLSEWLAPLTPKLKIIPETFKNLLGLTESSLALTYHLENLKNNSLSWLVSQNGELLTQSLKDLHQSTLSILESSRDLKIASASLDSKVFDETFGFDAKLAKTERFLDAFINWLDAPETKNLLILFQNPSELRPAGGFLGSYAEIALNRKGIQTIKVWDVYDPDGQLDIKIVPPQQLQGLTPSWGARDANWFFDFPSSAGKIISFLELSKIYRENQTSFDGVVALNINVVRSLLNAVGSIELPDYDFTITPENFLRELQREVETGEDKKSGEPKRILKMLTPILLKKLAELDDEQKRVILKDLKSHLDVKDIMIYSKDWEIERFLESAGIAGAVLELGENFGGDYLAVVNANVGGGKSDAVTNQKISLASKIEPTGRINNFLIIEKTHEGKAEKDPWYRAENKSYFKVFTPLGSRLTYAAGNTPRTLSLKSFSDAYLTDPLLTSIESTVKPIKEFAFDELRESNKTVFASWLNVKAGTTKKVELQYYNPTKLTLFSQPIPYRFIFEKQSGARASLDFLLEAPPDHYWLETNSPIFNYVNADPPGRLIIDLTLVPNPAANQR